MGTLYIVPTPIGNLEDITLRALRILREVNLIAAEDTRTSRILLQHYQIPTPLTSYHEHNKLTKLDAVFAALAEGDVALVSDAGTPGISDPGYELIQAAIERGCRIEPLPGANAIIPALVASGLPTDGFLYLGFLPRKDKALREFLESVVSERRTLVAYESPNRLLAALQAVLDILGDRRVCVAREVSKKFEEFQRGSVSAVLTHYRANPPRGEITLVIGSAPPAIFSAWDALQVQAALDARLEAGESLSSAAKVVAAQSGWERRAVYNLGANRTPE
jgi:16S rRNA (cytidine1402-2'-O)-methyltransferase